MFRQMLSASLFLALSGSLLAATQAEEAARAKDPVAARLGDALKLCEKLAGVEREICVRQAQENQKLADKPPVGATPGGSPATGGGVTR